MSWQATEASTMARLSKQTTEALENLLVEAFELEHLTQSLTSDAGPEEEDVAARKAITVALKNIAASKLDPILEAREEVNAFNTVVQGVCTEKVRFARQPLSMLACCVEALSSIMQEEPPGGNFAALFASRMATQYNAKVAINKQAHLVRPLHFARTAMPRDLA
jgi:hypothetical protein